MTQWDSRVDRRAADADERRAGVDAARAAVGRTGYHGAGGLTSAEARGRLQRHGFNEIAAARHWTDSVIIAVLVVMNGLVAFTEERQAASAIAALKQRLVPNGAGVA